MTDHAEIDAMIVGKHARRTIGTCRQYAEQSKAWQNGEGRSEDQYLQRIWNLADDSTTLIDLAHALVAERDEAVRDWKQYVHEIEDEKARADAISAARHRWQVRAEAAEAERDRLVEAIASAMGSLASGPAQDGYAYSVLGEALSAALAAEETTTDG